MKLIRLENYEEMSSCAASLVEQQILNNRHSVLGLATARAIRGIDPGRP